MRGYGERDFVRALVPILIGRLPNPLEPTYQDMLKVAEATEKWAGRLVDLRADKKWEDFLIDWNNDVSWNDADYDLEDEDES